MSTYMISDLQTNLSLWIICRDHDCLLYIWGPFDSHGLIFIGDRYVIPSHTLLDMRLHHAGIEIKPRQ